MDGPAEITKHYLISGRVQGVGYRAYTERNAARLGVTGWVRNLADGRVEALARGRPEVLTELEACLRRGPAHGRVDALLIGDWKSGEAFTGFSIGKDGKDPCCES